MTEYYNSTFLISLDTSSCYCYWLVTWRPILDRRVSLALDVDKYLTGLDDLKLIKIQLYQLHVKSVVVHFAVTIVLRNT